MVPFPESILVKTPRGSAELSERTDGLCPLARQVLILADGKRTVAELAAELGLPASNGRLRHVLVTLERGRYVDRLEEIRIVA